MLKGGMLGLAALTVQQAAARDAAAQGKPPGFDGLVHLNPREAELVDAAAERIWPETRKGPGARAAGAVHYIDRALAGPYARHQATYRRGIQRLDEAAKASHGRWFAELGAADQDSLLVRLEKNELPQFRAETGRAFFELLRTHTMEGVLADPMYGGNRDFAGWKAVGYPGPYYQITEEEQQRTSGPVALPLHSVADL